MVAAKAGPCAYDYYPQSWGNVANLMPKIIFMQRKIFGKGDIQVFITPLFSYKLVDAKVKAIAYNDSIRHSTDSFSTPTRFLGSKTDSGLLRLGRADV